MKMLNSKISLIILAVGLVAYHADMTDSCELEFFPFIYVPTLREDVTGVFWYDNIRNGTISNPGFTRYAEVFNVTITPNENGTLVELSPGERFVDYLDIIERNKTLDSDFTYNCNQGSGDEFKTIGVVILFFIDTNNRSPTFNVNELSLNITTNWNASVPINVNSLIQVSDADFELENSYFILTLDPPDLLTVSYVPLWNDTMPVPITYETDILLYLNPEKVLDVGTTLIEITATDHINPDSKMSLQLTVDREIQ